MNNSFDMKRSIMPTRLMRVSRKRVCLICGKPDWCGFSEDGQLHICMRIQEGSSSMTSHGGYIHQIKELHLSTKTWLNKSNNRQPRSTKHRYEKPSIIDTTNWPVLANIFKHKANENYLCRLSNQLGIDVDSLNRIDVGWSPRNKAWTFPMRQIDKTICGIRLRNWQGQKWAIKGSKQGLFMPCDLPQKLLGLKLFVAEGPTDTAALLGLGLAAVGKPSCRGMEQQIVQLAKQTATTQIVITADHDKAGQDGATYLASQLNQAGIYYQILTPPAGIKDVRAWKQAGVTANDITHLLKADLGGVQ